MKTVNTRECVLSVRTERGKYLQHPNRYSVQKHTNYSTRVVPVQSHSEQVESIFTIVIHNKQNEDNRPNAAVTIPEQNKRLLLFGPGRIQSRLFINKSLNVERLIYII